MLHRILNELVHLTRPYQLTGRWQFLAPSDSVRINPGEANALAAALAERFTPEQLVASRVFQQGDEQRACLSPVLARAASPFLLLRRRAHGLPTDVVNENGSLASEDPPLFRSGRDYRTRAYAKESGLILAAMSDVDVAVLCMLNLPAVPASRLDVVTAAQARRLYRGHMHPAQPAQNAEKPAAISAAGFPIVLVGWQVASLSLQPPPTLKATVMRLANAEALLHVDSESRNPLVKIWVPTEADLQSIRIRSEFVDPDLVRAAMRESFENSTRTVRQCEEIFSLPSSADYLAANRGLREALIRARDWPIPPEQVANLLVRLERAFDVNVVNRMIETAMREVDPVRQVLELAIAELMGLWHATSPLVEAARLFAAGGRPAATELLGSETLAQRLDLVEQILKIYKALRDR